MNDNYPRMKHFFYWHRPNIILSIPIYEYFLICIAIISVYHSLSNRYRMFCHDLYLGIQRCFEEDQCMYVYEIMRVIPRTLRISSSCVTYTYTISPVLYLK